MNNQDNIAATGLCKIKRCVITATQLDSQPEDDWVIEEQAIALVFNEISHAVMMATPCDLLDFAIGFSLSEGIISQAKDILAHEIVHTEQGIEVQLSISSRQFSALKHKRRSLLGNSGCGLCGVESLAQTVKVRAKLEITPALNFQVVSQAVDTFKQRQRLNELTGSVHAAAFCSVDSGEILCIREDVGRHNALDKLLGALAQQPYNTEQKRRQGFILVSSRASYEMVDKTIAAGINHLVSISAATSKAIQWAQQHQLNLIGFARSKRYLMYTSQHK